MTRTEARPHDRALVALGCLWFALEIASYLVAIRPPGHRSIALFAQHTALSVVMLAAWWICRRGVTPASLSTVVTLSLVARASLVLVPAWTIASAGDFAQ